MFPEVLAWHITLYFNFRLYIERPIVNNNNNNNLKIPK